jgi:hypothetical protein
VRARKGLCGTQWINSARTGACVVFFASARLCALFVCMSTLPPLAPLGIVESWQPPVNNTARTIHVYSNAPEVQVALNGVAVGKALEMPYQVWETRGLRAPCTSMSTTYLPRF